MAVLTSFLVQNGTPMEEDERGRRTYEVSWEVTTNDPTDSPLEVLTIARTLGGINNPVAGRGAAYSFGGSSDLGSFARRFSVAKLDAPNSLTKWVVTAHYGPVEDGETQTQLQQVNPLLWPTQFWINWVEEQVPLEKARNVDAMDQITRPALTEGPVVNAAGQEFTTPAMKTVFHPIINAQKNYATLEEIYELNADFQGTTNDSTIFDGLFPPRTVRFLTAESGQIQNVGSTFYYTGVIRLEVNLKTWDREILNIGYKSLEDGVLTTIQIPDEDDVLEPVSEPVQLNADGTRGDDETAANYIKYRDLEDAQYDDPGGLGIGA